MKELRTDIFPKVALGTKRFENPLFMEVGTLPRKYAGWDFALENVICTHEMIELPAYATIVAGTFTINNGKVIADTKVHNYSGIYASRIGKAMAGTVVSEGWDTFERSSFCGKSTLDRLILPKEMSLIQVVFNLINPDEIKQFLIYNTELISALLECRNKIISLFGNIEPKIELVTDVELPEWKTIFVIIPHNLADKKFDENLNSLLMDWVFYQSKKFKKLISIISE